MSNQLIKLAIIGLGKQGREHLKAMPLLNNVQISVGVESNIAAHAELQRDYPNLKIVSDIKALDLETIHGIILAVPHDSYSDIWPEVLNFGLPVLKEKPLGRNYQEAMDFVQKAKAANCPLQTAIQRRHHPSYMRLKEYIESKNLPIEQIHAHFHLGFNPHKQDNSSWRADIKKSGGGALLDSGYHFIDIIHYLIGTFDLITASLWKNAALLPYDAVEDRAWLTGKTESCWVFIDTWVAGAPDVQTESGYKKSEGILIQSGEDRLFANRTVVLHNDQEIACYPNDWQDAMRKQLENFAENIRRNTWQDEAIWDQLPAMRIVEEAYKQSILS